MWQDAFSCCANRLIHQYIRYLDDTFRDKAFCHMILIQAVLLLALCKCIREKTRIRLENTPRRCIPKLYYCVDIPWDIPLKYPLKRFMISWPWPLPYDLDLQTRSRYHSTWPTYQNSSLYVCPFGCEIGNTHRQTDTHTQMMPKLLHPTRHRRGV